jgi:hypothetical protein
MLPYDHSSYFIAQPVDKGCLILDLVIQLSDILCCIKHIAKIKSKAENTNSHWQTGRKNTLPTLAGNLIPF